MVDSYFLFSIANMTQLLKHLPVLVLDCQTTGANPDKGRLLEIGWAEIRAFGSETSMPIVESWLLDTAETSIPPRVRAITGITPEDLRDARSPAEVWARLEEAARTVRKKGECETCPVVIHYARFEEPFLRWLHRDHSPESPFPFFFICTHEIAKRLFPGLPRRGLRAVAGYLGYSIAELRRASDHVAATVWIWRKMVEELDAKKGILTLDELLDWLSVTPGPVRTGREWPMERETRLSLPDCPGVYRMLRSNRDVLYVGKADSLRKRVNSYFRKRTGHAEHILEMLSQARDLDVTVAGSALEAALLESDEIKRLSPPYNISLRAAERKLLFCSSDFLQFDAEAGENFPIGPLSSDEVAAFPVILDLLENGCPELPEDSDIPARALGIPVEYSPGQECFLRGFAIFSGKYGELLKGKSLPGVFMMLGVHLWRERETGVEGTDEESESSPEGGDESASQSGEWTPESVLKALEGVILRGAWHVRRARWFCALSESALFFREPRCNERKGRLLIIERGIVVLRKEMAPDGEMPVPFGHGRSGRERRRNFDLSTWDRLRVLTTEMRRIIAKGGDISLLLSAGKPLTCEKLGKALSWV